ncbi:MAG: diaminopimelate epimerase [Phycisphaerales bacterium]|nr:MAG: diaminopimelate epimerase [Phycisphaerales bacterium]
MTDVPFIKMHGIGNDYLLVAAFDRPVDELGDVAQLARRMSDRHFGVGADGLILLLPPEDGVEADVRMRMFNADGSEAEMCGNGIRCLCKLAREDGICRRNPMRVQTGAGVLSLDYEVDETDRVCAVTVDMGRPVLDLARIPVIEDRLVRQNGPASWTLEVGGVCWSGVFVSMGNPHVVFFAEQHPDLWAGPLRELELGNWGPDIEHHPAFPERINAHWVEVISRGEMAMRTWERGSGRTLACGTGAAAVCVAGVLTKRTRRNVLIHLPGGDLRAIWSEETGRVLVNGPAAEICRGYWRR